MNDDFPELFSPIKQPNLDNGMVTSLSPLKLDIDSSVSFMIYPANRLLPVCDRCLE